MGGQHAGYLTKNKVPKAVLTAVADTDLKKLELAKKNGGVDRETLEAAVTLLAPFAPHICEELWSELGHETSVFVGNQWPEYDKAKMADDEKEIAVQLNGKTRCVVTLPVDIDKEAALAKGKEALGDRLTGTIVKEIYVPGKIINIVAK